MPTLPRLSATFRTIRNPGSCSATFRPCCLTAPVFVRRLIGSRQWSRPDTELIAGIEARGFMVAAGLSYALGLGKLMLRKPGKLPGEKIGTDYHLEYGTDRIEMHVGHVQPGQKVLLVDDLIATGGTAMAGVDLIRQAGGVVEQALFIVDLPELGGTEKLQVARNHRCNSLIGFDGD